MGRDAEPTLALCGATRLASSPSVFPFGGILSLKGNESQVCYLHPQDQVGAVHQVCTEQSFLPCSSVRPDSDSVPTTLSPLLPLLLEAACSPGNMWQTGEFLHGRKPKMNQPPPPSGTQYTKHDSFNKNSAQCCRVL